MINELVKYAQQINQGMTAAQPLWPQPIQQGGLESMLGSSGGGIQELLGGLLGGGQGGIESLLGGGQEGIESLLGMLGG